MPISNFQMPLDNRIFGGHLSADALAAFVAHNLSADEEMAIFRHLNECQSCREWVFVSAGAECVQKKPLRSFRMPARRAPASIWLNATGTAALFLVLLLLPFWRFEQRGLQPGRLESQVHVSEMASTRATPSEQLIENLPTLEKVNLGRQKSREARRRKVLSTESHASVSPSRSQPHAFGGDFAITSLLLKGTLAEPEPPKRRFWNEERGDSFKPLQPQSWPADVNNERWSRLSLNAPPLTEVSHSTTRTLWAHAKLIASLAFNESDNKAAVATDAREAPIESVQFVKHVVLTKTFQ